MNKNPSFKFERPLWNKGYNLIAGLDEVGRGAFAGPVVAAAVILPKDFKINGINDSKKLTHKKRAELSKYIKKHSNSYVICKVGIKFINKHGIGKATEKAFLNCIKRINKVEYLLIDGYKIKKYGSNNQMGIIHGDSLSVSIAAASIIAKVYRDNFMTKLHNKFPEYNFLENKGYGTKKHRDAIRKHGLSEIHRTSFKLSKYYSQDLVYKTKEI